MAKTAPDTAAPAPMEVAADKPAIVEIDEKRESKIEAFLDEFAANDATRKKLRDAVINKTPVDGGSKYFQSELKKIQGV
jgi:hypothetical protein